MNSNFILTCLWLFNQTRHSYPPLQTAFVTGSTQLYTPDVAFINWFSRFCYVPNQASLYTNCGPHIPLLTITESNQRSRSIQNSNHPVARLKTIIKQLLYTTKSVVLLPPSISLSLSLTHTLCGLYRKETSFNSRIKNQKSKSNKFPEDNPYCLLLSLYISRHDFLFLDFCWLSFLFEYWIKKGS